MTTTSPATYGLLGLLATRSWTGYELTAQVRRSLAFVWPTSEGHLYREQKVLVARGWAAVVDEPAGRRSRKRYTITDAGVTDGTGATTFGFGCHDPVLLPRPIMRSTRPSARFSSAHTRCGRSMRFIVEQ